VKRSSDAVVLIVISNSAGHETALGSGFLVSANGDIVTNYHVIKEAHSAIVKLSNGAFFPVIGVVASDADKDLAIIKVDGKNLPFLSLGDDDKLQVGEHVAAIGSPLGLEGTVSDGIVSAFRDVAGRKWIQITAPVSHGNSGGPLLDMNNHVVGVITWGVSLELGQNLNFAAPSNELTALLAAAHQQAKPLAEPDLGRASTPPNQQTDTRAEQSAPGLYINSMYVTAIQCGQFSCPQTIVTGVFNNKVYTLGVTVGAFSTPWTFETEKSYPVVSTDGRHVKISVPYKNKLRTVSLNVTAVEPIPNTK
jgi:S1-C subfamily serine protease